MQPTLTARPSRARRTPSAGRWRISRASLRRSARWRRASWRRSTSSSSVPRRGRTTGTLPWRSLATRVDEPGRCAAFAPSSAKVTIPRKCAGCSHLVIDRQRGFDCEKDRSIWGDWMRGLDWGTWRPERIYLALRGSKVTTRAMADAVYDDDLVEFRTRVPAGQSRRLHRRDQARLRGPPAAHRPPVSCVDPLALGFRPR